MYCSNCGKSVSEAAVACPACGVPPRKERKFCFNCGQPVQPNQIMCTSCGASLARSSGAKSRVTAGLLGIFLGSLGIHKFYLGYNKEGLIMLLLTLLTFGVGAVVMEIIALIEGIMYLGKSDEEFEAIYVTERKGWF